MSHLDSLDLSLNLSHEEAEQRLAAAQERLLALRLSSAGWSASGSSARRCACCSRAGTRPARAARSSASSASSTRATCASRSSPRRPTTRSATTSCWRFWPALPGWGGMAVLDRSWYGRVLVERVEGFATEDAVEARLRRDQRRSSGCSRDEGTILVKFWLHISAEEQLKRFEARERGPAQALEADRRGLAQPREAPAYEAAIEEMLDAPHRLGAVDLVEADSKRYARVKVIETVIDAIEAACARGLDLPPRRS